MSIFRLLVACSLAFCGCFGAKAESLDRIALVIGNGAYQNVPQLPNPPRDAGDVAAELERIGFAVTRLSNGDFEDMRKALIQFGKSAAAAKMAIVYYAGHGMELNGMNWLIPVDAVLQSETEIDQEAIPLASVIDAVAGSRFGLVILDACRDDPFVAKIRRKSTTRGVTRGLAPVSPRSNLLVAYAARDGTTAEDGNGRNSPFTTALLKNMVQPGLEVEMLFRRIRTQVIEETNGKQEPFTYGSLSKDPVFLVPAVVSTEAPVLPDTGLSESANECDRFAASPDDDEHPSSVSGVAIKSVDVKGAMVACEAAIRAFPKIARFYFQAGRAAYAAQDYARARGLFEAAGDLGNSAAKQNLAILYLNGWGVDKNIDKAKALLKESATAGNKLAMGMLGVLYSDNTEFGKDTTQALYWLAKGAAAGDPGAINGLGVLYQRGQGTLQDYAAARTWYEKAAALGDGTAMRNVGSLYEHGLGVAKNLQAARQWYERAAAAGDKESITRLQSIASVTPDSPQKHRSRKVTRRR